MDTENFADLIKGSEMNQLFRSNSGGMQGGALQEQYLAKLEEVLRPKAKYIYPRFGRSKKKQRLADIEEAW